MTSVSISAGTGNPFFTTDSAACLRGIEIESDAVLKATKVDGFILPIQCYPDAVKYDRLDYQTVLQNELRVMDLSAFTLARDHNIPIIVFNMNKPRFEAVIAGEAEGTFIGAETQLAI